MLFIILSWIYITVTSFLLGCLFTFLLRKLFRIPSVERLHFSVVCINGLLFTSFLLSVWVLFYKVDLLANLFVLILSLCSFLFLKTEIISLVRESIFSIKRASKSLWFFFGLFVIIMAAVSYIPSSHADDSGAFSPLIKWIQEYGAVPGIANLDARFGYNSTWFSLQALYGFAFLKPAFFNDLNGLLFLYLLLYSMEAIDLLLKGHTSFLNYLRSFFFLPVVYLYFGFSHDILLFSIQFFTSPTYDIPVTFVMWIVFFLFLGLKDKKEAFHSSILPYLIVVYIAWLITVKLNAVPLVFIGLFLVGNFLLRKNYRAAILLSILGICILLPWMAKTVISCGYLIFPFTELDVLHVDWKVPIQAVLYIENSIITWAIDPEIYGTGKFNSGMHHFSVPIREWFPVWYSHINYINSILFFTTIGVTVYFLCWLIWKGVKNRMRFSWNDSIDMILVLTLFAGILLWFTKGPLFRYGYGYLLFYCIWALTMLVYYLLNEFRSEYIGIAILVYFTYAGAYYYQNLWQTAKKAIVALPKKEQVPAYRKLDLGQGRFINIIETDASDNAPLPCSPQFEYNDLRPVYRGKTIKEGFRSQHSMSKQASN